MGVAKGQVEWTLGPFDCPGIAAQQFASEGRTKVVSPLLRFPKLRNIIVLPDPPIRRRTHGEPNSAVAANRSGSI